MMRDAGGGDVAMHMAQVRETRAASVGINSKQTSTMTLIIPCPLKAAVAAIVEAGVSRYSALVKVGFPHLGVCHVH